MEICGWMEFGSLSGALRSQIWLFADQQSVEEFGHTRIVSTVEA